MNTNAIRTTIAAIAIGAAAIAVAPAASADAETDNEVAFVMTLDDEGITYNSEDGVIGLGYSICDAFDAGMSFAQAVRAGVNNSPLSAGDVGYVIGASVAAFCPYHADTLGSTN